MKSLGLPFTWRAAAAGIPLFVLYLLVPWITATFVLMLWPGARTAPPSLPLAVVIVLAVVEEIAAAFAIQSLSRHGAAAAIAAGTLLRFALHLYEWPLAALSVIPLGILVGAMYWRWRNVWPLIVGHGIASVLAFAVGPQ